MKADVDLRRFALVTLLISMTISGATGAAEPGLYDPLGLAIDRLNGEGNSPPAGYTIRDAKPGELADENLARTDHEGMEIIVNTPVFEAVVCELGGPCAVVDVIAGILWHEYRHTAEYGGDHPDSTDPPGGYNNDFCDHAQLYEDMAEFICVALIPGSACELEALCQLHNMMIKQVNGLLSVRNKKCPGTHNKLFLCDDCTE